MYEYLDIKFIEYILYSSTETLNETLDIELLKKLNKYLKKTEIQNKIDNNIKQKIYDIIEYMRFAMGKNKDPEYNEQINIAIIATNNCTAEYCVIFYYDQYKARTLENENNIFKTSLDKAAMQKIYESISNDYRVLKDIIKPSSQYKKIIDQYIGSEEFLHSIKGMYYENPSIFEQLSVQINIMKTLMENQKLIKAKESSIESKILKKYNRQTWDLIIKR